MDNGRGRGCQGGGIDTEGDVFAREAKFVQATGNGSDGVKSRGGAVTIRNASIEGNNGAGIKVDDHLTLLGTDNYVRRNGKVGISGPSHHRYVARIEGGEISGNCGWGIYTNGLLAVEEFVKINSNGRRRPGCSDPEGGGINTENDVLAQEADLVEVIGNGDDGVRTKGTRADVVLTNAKVNDNLGDGIQAQGVVKLRQSEVCRNRGYGIFADRRDLKQVRLDCDNRRGPWP